jgi:hypothetical protein
LVGGGRSDLFQAGAFVRYNAGAAYLTAALAYGWQDITTDRTVTVAGIDRLRAEFKANAWSGRLEGAIASSARDLASRLLPRASSRPLICRPTPKQPSPAATSLRWLVGGLTAMPGALPAIWCDFHGLPRTQQRGLVQRYIGVMRLFALALMLSHHSLSLKVLIDFGISLPALAAGTAAGIVLFGRINEVAFKRIILGLLLFSGLCLVI